MKTNALILLSLVACGGDPTTTPTTESFVAEANDALSGYEVRTRAISDVTHDFTVKLDATTVLCSAVDYSGTFLKITVPQIADVTLFDHRNFGAGGPCMAAIRCVDGTEPQKLINENPTEDINLRVQLTGLYHINHDTKECTVSLRENLSTDVRGQAFKHQREGQVSSRQYEDCLGIH